MRRTELYHAIRASCQIIQRNSVIIIGSQSILASFSEDDLPAQATMSQEIDILPMEEDSTLVDELSDLLEGVAGELSQFEVTHGFHLDGVRKTTAVLPPGWESRLVRVANESTRSLATGELFTGWCLDPLDLCVAKLVANREKDREFVYAPLSEKCVDTSLLLKRLDMLPPQHREATERARYFVEATQSPHFRVSHSHSNESTRHE